MMEQTWIGLQSAHRMKFALLEDRSTLGSAESNSIVLDEKGVRPLHGQFVCKDGTVSFKDFAEKRQVEIKQVASEDVQVAGWQVALLRNEADFKVYYPKLLNSFRTTLSNLKFDFDLALEIFRKEYFGSFEVPEHLISFLSSQFQEISLLGPIEGLLKDQQVTDILVERFDRIWIERKGELQLSTASFSSDEGYRIYLENLLTSLQKTFDETHPYLDFTLQDGSRGHLIGPPLTEGYFHLSIRKVREDFFKLENLLELEMFSKKIYDQLLDLLHSRKNILIAGATGSGKTTLLRALLYECQAHERLIILEDTPELKLPRKNSVFLCTRIDARGVLPPVTLRHLVRQCLRMRPDRIIVGEVRGEEALDLLHAMNTGHRGCMGSLHANSSRDALARLEGLAKMASSSLSEAATRDLIVRNIHAVIFCGRDKNKNRTIEQVSLLRGLNGQTILLEDLPL